MTYKVPKCNCGAVLVYSDSITQERFYKIKSDGTPFKNPVKTCNSDLQHSNLYCRKCRATYAIDSYSVGPILRGGLIYST